MIEVTDKKIDFLGIFKRYMENPYSNRHSTWEEDDYEDMYGSLFGDDYYGDSSDWWEEYEMLKKKKKNKKKDTLVWDKETQSFLPINEVDNKKKKQKKTKEKYTESFLESDKHFDNVSDFTYNRDDKYIYYYPDIHNKDNKKEFHSLFEFDEFITENNINITEWDVSFLMRKQVVHCTSINNLGGVKTLITDKSFSGLIANCSEMNYLKETV